MAVAIRRPSGVNSCGNPDLAVLRNIAPLSVIIEIFGADHIRGDVGMRAIFSHVSLLAPVVEIVGGRQVLLIRGELIRAGKYDGLIRLNRKCLASAGDFALTTVDCDDAGVAGFIDGDAIV